MTPVLASIARKGSFLGHQGNYGEDAAFRQQIIDHIKPGPWVFINKVLYFYRWDLADSVQGNCPHEYPQQCVQKEHITPYWKRRDFVVPPPLAVSSPVFRWHERSIL
jgi:hypothetical protein